MIYYFYYTKKGQKVWNYLGNDISELTFIYG